MRATMFSHVLLASTCLGVVLPIAAAPQLVPNQADLVESVRPAVVLIRGRTPGGPVTGSGFIVTPDGKIVTNLHVIEHLETGGVQLASGETFDSFSVLAWDKRKDLALIQISGFDLPTVEQGNSNDVKPGEPVLLFGSPRGLEGTVTSGVVSAVRITEAGVRLIQTDAAANAGNSGGPLVNSRGQVIGVLNSKLADAENLNFAVAINYARGMLGGAQNSTTLAEVRKSLGATDDLFARGALSESYPARWRSLNSGITRVLRFDGDYIYATAVLPDEQSKRGDSHTYEFRKVDERFVGTYRGVAACYARWIDEWKQCRVEQSAELSSVSPTRIEGRLLVPPEGTKFDCRRCKYQAKPSEWSEFVWVPE